MAIFSETPVWNKDEGVEFVTHTPAMIEALRKGGIEELKKHHPRPKDGFSPFSVIREGDLYIE